MTAGEFERAIGQARESGYLGQRIMGTDHSFELHVQPGPRAGPRPDAATDVESVARVALAMNMGCAEFHQLGVEGDGGVRLFGLSGHVKRPGLYELPVGKNLKEFIYEEGGGVLDDQPLKGVIPGGSATPILLPGEIDVPLTVSGLEEAGSSLGTGCATVVAGPTCMVQVTLRMAAFHADSSCGRCAPCRAGCPWMAATVKQIEQGIGREEDIDLILSIGDRLQGQTNCPVGDAAAISIRALVTKFRSEFEEHVRSGKCPNPETLR